MRNPFTQKRFANKRLIGLKGVLDKEIAKRIGISVSTLCQGKHEHKEFAEALKKSKAIVDYRGEDSLLKRALGYEVVEVIKERQGGHMVVVKEITKHVPLDVTAQIFWLKNRKPEAWRDKQQVENSGVVKITVEFVGNK